MLTKSIFLKKSNFFILFIFFVILIRVLSLFFSKIDLQGDEAQYWFWSTYFDWGYFSKPPFIAWIIFLFTSVFGNSVFIIKLPSLLAHMGTAISLFYLSKSFKRTNEEGLWLALSYLLFFAISLSSNIISTDPFLLLFWTLSLLYFNELNKNQSLKNIVLTSIFIALGFYAKYAMIYFFLSSLVFAFIVPNKKIYIKNIFVIVCLVFILFSPHLFWIYSNGWVTITHTADNFNWGSRLFNFDQLLNFIIGQFFITTPIIFYFYIKTITNIRATLKVYAFEISYSLPIILLVLIQSFISRANANWASVAFIGIAMIAINVLFNNYKKILVINSVLGFLIMLIVSFILLFPPNLSPFNKLTGMKKAAEEIEFLDSSLNSKYILFDDRMTISKFLYYLNSKQYKMKFLSDGINIDNHFSMMMPLSEKNISNEKIIFIHRYEEIPEYIKDKVLVSQLYEMPNKKNNFYISYIE
tara:strand:+ start:675 stop:2081 length:1407 start_codon:yes stop_codon:yes gene_type:complete